MDSSLSNRRVPSSRIWTLFRLVGADGIGRFAKTIRDLHRVWRFPFVHTTLFFLRRFGFYALDAVSRGIRDLHDRIGHTDDFTQQAADVLARLFGPKAPTNGYVIWCETYSRRSAGNYCLHRLCHDLNQRGICAVMAGDPYPPAEGLVAPVVIRRQAKRLVRRGFVAVYPEIVCGNPLKAPRVVRWCLNKPGVLGGDKTYAATEKVFTYADAFRFAIQSPVIGKLYLPTIDETLFFDNGVPSECRALTCYYTGKSGYRPGFINPNETLEITRTYPKREELGKIFRQTRTLYSFDCTTILVQEALLCGCRVVLIPDGSQSRNDIQNSEFGAAGIRWFGDADTPEADIAARTRQRLNDIRANYERDLTHFIELTLPDAAWAEAKEAAHHA